MLGDDNWARYGRCCGAEPELFFAAPGSREKSRAKRIRYGCPVVTRCLSEALADPQMRGVWGGQGQLDRMRLATRVRRF